MGFLWELFNYRIDYTDWEAIAEEFENERKNKEVTDR